MSETPEPGWYADPTDSARHRYWDGTQWTDRTRSAAAGTDAPIGAATDASPPRRSGRRVAAIVVAAVLGIGAITGGAIALASSDKRTATSDDETVVASVPGDWVERTALSGAVTLSVDPEWTDMNDPSIEESLLGSAGAEGQPYATELVGVWLASGTELNGSIFFVVAMGMGVPESMLPIEARLATQALAEGIPGYVELVNESETTASGDAAWRVDFSTTEADVALNGSVLIIVDESTTVICEAVSAEDFDEWLDDFLAMARSVSLR